MESDSRSRSRPSLVSPSSPKHRSSKLQTDQAEAARINLFSPGRPRSGSITKQSLPRLPSQSPNRSPPAETARFGQKSNKPLISSFTGKSAQQVSFDLQAAEASRKKSHSRESSVQKELVAFRNQIRRLNPEEKVLYIQNAIRGAQMDASKDLVTLRNKNDANGVVLKKISDIEKENQFLKETNFKMASKLTKLQKKAAQYKTLLQEEFQGLDNKVKIRDSLKEMLMSYRTQASLLGRSAKRLPFSTAKYDPERENKNYTMTSDTMKIPTKAAEQIEKARVQELVVQPFDLIKVMKQVKTIREEESEKVKSTINKRNRAENSAVQVAETIEAAVSKRYVTFMQDKGLSQKVQKDVIVEGQAPEPEKPAPDPKATTKSK